MLSEWSRTTATLAGLAALALAWPATLPAADTSTDLEARCRAEVVELHEFLELWSNGELQPTEAAFARFAAVIAPGFRIIDPDGEVAGRGPIVDAIRRAHGRWLDTPGRIRIERFTLHHTVGDHALATYEEWHEVGDDVTGRLSSVLFGPNAGAPNGLEWLHLHEVWISEE